MALDEVRVYGSRQLINLESPIRVVRTFLGIVELLAASRGSQNPRALSSRWRCTP